LAAGEVDGPDVPLAADFDFQPFADGVHGGDADAVEAAGAHFVSAFAVELSAGVDLGHDDFDGGAVVHLGHGADGDASPVVDDGHAAIGVDLDDDEGGVAVHGFVHGVVDDFVD